MTMDLPPVASTLQNTHECPGGFDCPTTGRYFVKVEVKDNDGGNTISGVALCPGPPDTLARCRTNRPEQPPANRNPCKDARIHSAVANQGVGTCSVRNQNLLTAANATIKCETAPVPPPGGGGGGKPDDAGGAGGCILVPNSVRGYAGGDGINAILNDLTRGGAWDPAGLLDTDPSSFAFSGEAMCSGIDVASEHGNGVGIDENPMSVWIDAIGTVDSLVCGSGTASGNLTLTTPDIVSISTTFGLTFGGGAGVLSLVVEDEGFVGENNVDGGSGGGAIDIFTGNTGNCLNENITEILVNGGFALTLTGEGSSATTPVDDSDI